MSVREFIKKFYNSNFCFKIRELINTFKYKLFIKKKTIRLKKKYLSIKENITFYNCLIHSNSRSFSKYINRITYVQFWLDTINFACKFYDEKKTQLIIEKNINILSKNYLNIDLQLKKIILEIHSYYKFLSKEIFSILFSNFLLVNKNKFNKSKCIKENLIISFIRKFNLTQRYSNNNFNNNEKLKIYKELIFIFKSKKKLTNSFFCHYMNSFKTHHLTNLNKIKKNNNDLIKNKDQNIFGSTFYAFGHMLLFIFEKKKSFLPKKNKIIIAPSFIANNFLGLIIKKIFYKNTIISNKIFLDCTLNKKFHFDEITTDHNLKNFASNLAFKEFKKYGLIKKIINKKDLYSIVEKYNLKPYSHPKKYVCIYFKDSSFKMQKKTNELVDTFSNPCDFTPLIKYLINLGYDVIRIGDSYERKVTIKDKRFFEYSHSNHKNDYNDILIPYNSEFIICTGFGGGNWLPHVLRKYSLHLDYPFHRRNRFDDLMYLQIKPLIDLNNNSKLVNIQDYYSEKIGITHNFNTLINNGIKIIKTDPQIYKDCLDKFLIFLKNKNNCLFNYSNQKNEIPYNILEIDRTCTINNEIKNF